MPEPTPPLLFDADDIVDTVRQPMLVLSADLRVRRVNRCFCQTFRVTPEESLGRPVYDLGNRQWDIPALRTLLEDILPHDTAFDDFEVAHEFESVGRKVMLLNARRIFRAGSQVEYILLAVEDVTERRRLEGERHELETRFTSLVRNIRDHSIFTTDPDGRITSWNVEAQRIMGHSEAEILGQDFSIIFTPEDLEQGVPGCELRTALESGRAEDERWHLRKGGERFWALGIVTPTHDAQGRHTGFSKILRDMTDRRRAEEESGRLRRVYETALSNTVDFNYVFDLEGRFAYANESLLALWRKGPPEVVGKRFSELDYPPDLAARLEGQIRQAIASGWPVRDEAAYTSHLGDRQYEYILVPVSGAGGAVEAVVGSTRDITDRKRAEAALRQSEADLRQMADAMPQIVWVARPDGYHEYYNRRWYEYVGCAPQECVGHGWNLPLHPDDRQRAIDRWGLALCTGDPYEIEYRFRSGGGEYRWFLGRALPVRDDAGRVVKWFGTCTDIEDSKRAEADRQKFVSLAENSTDFIGVCDPDGVPLYVNRAGLGMVGLADIGQARRTPVREFFFPEDQPKMIDGFFPSIRERGHGEVEVRLRHFGTGEAVWVMYSVFALTGPQGDRVGLATVSRDITHRRRLEDDLRRLAAELSEAHRRKDEFLATLAHELRNPLAPIRNSLQILKMPKVDAATAERSREVIERQVHHLVRLVDDLLDVSRVMQGKIELRRERVELATVVARAVETAQPLLDAQGHELTVGLPGESLPLDADPVRLAQVVGNLLTNAAKYTEKGGRIWITAGREGGGAVLRVRDTGIGIAPDVLPRIFDLFVQVDHAATRSQGGLGIGLTLVKNLVGMHGGTVEARSGGLGGGSEFVVRLPLSAQGREGPAGASGGPPRKESAAGRRVLVVDDNVDAADSLATLLRLGGHEVRVANGGTAALDTANDYRAEVVFLDIGMPGMDGHEVARRLRGDPKLRGVVLVALTGWGQEEDRRRSADAGFDHHLVKPVEPKALEGVLADPRLPKRSEDG